MSPSIRPPRADVRSTDYDHRADRYARRMRGERRDRLQRRSDDRDIREHTNAHRIHQREHGPAQKR